jgi:hypothetical protein
VGGIKPSRFKALSIWGDVGLTRTVLPQTFDSAEVPVGCEINTECKQKVLREWSAEARMLAQIDAKNMEEREREREGEMCEISEGEGEKREGEKGEGKEEKKGERKGKGKDRDTGTALSTNPNPNPNPNPDHLFNTDLFDKFFTVTETLSLKKGRYINGIRQRGLVCTPSR